MALDIEHFAKVKLIQTIEASPDDGYQIVEDYKTQLKVDDAIKNTHHYNDLINDIERNRDNPYCGGLIDNYGDCYPIWAFVEIIPLGTLIHFLSFCAKKFNKKDLTENYYLLKTIKELRNAAAHNNCIIHDMGAKDSKHKPNYSMLRALKDISKATRDNQLKNERMRQMITLLYTHTIFVTSPGIHYHIRSLLRQLVRRMYLHIDYYDGNENILKSFDFFRRVVDILYK